MLWPLKGRRRPSHTTNSKNFLNISKLLINDHVKISENFLPKKARVARGKSDGKYLRAHGPTVEFQAQWLEHLAPHMSTVQYSTTATIEKNHSTTATIEKNQLMNPDMSCVREHASWLLNTVQAFVRASLWPLILLSRGEHLSTCI